MIFINHKSVQSGEVRWNLQIAGIFGVCTKIKNGRLLCKFIFRLLYCVHLHICWTMYDEMGMIFFCREVYHWLHGMYFLPIQVTFLSNFLEQFFSSK